MALSLQADACFENLRELDESLARTAQKSGSLRFALGVGLDALARSGGYAELGSTSIDDHGQERCERSPSWIRQSRQLARRLSELPCLRGVAARSESTELVRFDVDGFCGAPRAYTATRAWSASHGARMALSRPSRDEIASAIDRVADRPAARRQ